MDKQLKKITVITICYKQEDVIARTIESILNQKDHGLYKLIISDDHSPDKTWDIILKYRDLYPDIIVAHQNNPNKGIYGNLTEAQKLVDPDTDFIINCEGDDTLIEGYFEKIQEFLSSISIDPKKERCVIYSDWVDIQPSGRKVIHSQSIIDEESDFLSLALRGKICYRSAIYSIASFREFDPIPLDDGICMAEAYADLQMVLHSDKAYYVPYVGSTYYSSIGVSTRMKNMKILMERKNVIESLVANIPMDEKTKNSLLYEKERYLFFINRKIVHYFGTWKFYFLSNKKLGFRRILEQNVHMFFYYLHVIKW